MHAFSGNAKRRWQEAINGIASVSVAFALHRQASAKKVRFISVLPQNGSSFCWYGCFDSGAGEVPGVYSGSGQKQTLATKI